MNHLNPKEQTIRLLTKLNDDQVKKVISYIGSIQKPWCDEVEYKAFRSKAMEEIRNALQKEDRAKTQGKELAFV